MKQTTKTIKKLLEPRAFTALLTALLLTAVVQTAWSDNVTLQTDYDIPLNTVGHYYVNMPATGTNTLTLNNVGVMVFKVYDDGGKSGKYSVSSDGTLVLTAPTGYVLQISGSITGMSARSTWLTVYDGNSTSGTKLIDQASSQSSGYARDINTVTSSGRSMTLCFYAGSSSFTYDGLDLTVKLIAGGLTNSVSASNPATGGTITPNKSTARVNETVTLTATPQSGYLLNGISVKDAENYEVAVNWNEWQNNTATFTMPGIGVTVTPTFTNDLTAEGGLSANMPKTGTKTVTIPTGVRSFKLYDDGGSRFICSNNCNGTLVLTAPTGYMLKVTGSFRIDGSDKLTIYDGNGTSGTRLFFKWGTGNRYDVGTVTSNANAMTLCLTTDNYSNRGDLDLTVTVYNPNATYDVNVNNPATGGTVTTSKGKAKTDETVTVTATPQNGYLLNGLSVKDANNNDVAVNWNVLTNTATFTMPLTAVTVTPTFTKKTSLYINMPKTGTNTAIIPVGIESFKVYDDGGPDAYYSDDCSGTLVLTAPTGYVLQLSGNIATSAGFAYLTVYDGSDNTAAKLINKAASDTPGAQTTISTVISTGSTMTLYFYTYHGVRQDGLDLTVKLISETMFVDNAANTTVINNSNGLNNVTITGRTLYKDGGWNTICLPFDLTAEQVAASPLAGATIKELTAASISNGTLTLKFSKNLKAIEAGKPYIVKWSDTPDLTISTADEWNAFATAVNNGTTYEGKTVKLAADISVSTMVGTSSNKFKGTFDGDGHTLTISYNVTANYVAPFRYVESATIKNLRVAGSITTSKQFAGGLMAEPSGSCTINKCRSSVTINSTKSGDGTHGGFIGVARGDYSTITFNNCLFDGQLLGSNTNSCGGFVGWHEGKIKFTACYFKPSANVTIDAGNSATFARNNVTSIENSYYATEFGTAQGTAVGNKIASELCAALNNGGNTWQIINGNVVPRMNPNINNPRFTCVTFDTTDKSFDSGSGNTRVRFIGTYDVMTFTEADTSSVLLMGANDKLHYAGKGAGLRACRAYFKIGEDDSEASAKVITSFKLNFGDGEEEATGIISTTNCTDYTDKADAWHTISGIRLNGKPSQKGMYIHNGKTVVVE